MTWLAALPGLNVRIASGAQPARPGRAQRHHAFDGQIEQRLEVRVHRRQSNVGKLALRGALSGDVLDGVAAGAAHAKNFQGEFFSW